MHRAPDACIESIRQSLSDGYQDTTAYVTVDARSVTVTSASNLDGSFSDIGLVVDQEPLVPMDRLAGIKTAHFRREVRTPGRALQGRRPPPGAAPVLAGVAGNGDALGHLQLDRVHQGLRRAGRLPVGGRHAGEDDMGLRLKFNLVLLLVFLVGLGVAGWISRELLHPQRAGRGRAERRPDDGGRARHPRLHRSRRCGRTSRCS